MSDPQSAARLSAEARLAAALRDLPLAAPAQSAWPALETALRAQGLAAAPRRPRWALTVPAALAAGLALALLLPRLASDPSAPPAPVAATAAAPVAEVDALQRQSQRLETWLAQLDAGAAPLGGADLMAAAETEDLIGLLDVQLAAAGTRAEAAALWRQRIALLEDLAAIRTGAASTDLSRLAEGRAAPAALPAL